MTTGKQYTFDGFRIDSAYITETGERNINEDSLEVGVCSDRFYALVADGLGGHGGGEIASGIAKEIIGKRIGQPNSLNKKTFDCIFNEIDKTIVNAHTAEVKMKTTVALVTFSKGKLYASHLGDTRVYIFNKGEISYFSCDDTNAFFSAFSGDGTLDDIRMNPNRHILSAALGGGKIHPPAVHSEKISGKISVLVCSDGFWEYVTEKEMLGSLAKAASSSEWLEKMLEVHKLKLRRYCDNYSAICLSIERI